MTEAEHTELLDWVSACQSAYHIDSTPGHRFGGLDSNLEENRAGLVAYVDGLLATLEARYQELADSAGRLASEAEADAADARSLLLESRAIIVEVCVSTNTPVPAATLERLDTAIGRQGSGK